MSKFPKKKWYKMELGDDGKRHRKWYEYSDVQWENIQNLYKMFLYGDTQKVPDKFIGLKEIING